MPLCNTPLFSVVLIFGTLMPEILRNGIWVLQQSIVNVNNDRFQNDFELNVHPFKSILFSYKYILLYEE